MMSSVDHAVSWRRQGDGFLSVPHPNLFIKPIPVRRINVSYGFFVTVDGSVGDAGRPCSPTLTVFPDARRATLAVWGR